MSSLPVIEEAQASCLLYSIKKVYLFIYLCIYFFSCLVEHSLGVVPPLFSLCIAHWFTSLSTLARHDEPGLNLALRIYSSLPSGSASFLCAALMSPQRAKQHCPQSEFIFSTKSPCLLAKVCRGNKTPTAERLSSIE